MSASTAAMTPAPTNAGAMVPFTEAFVQGTATVEYTLVGQVLDNGQTNWVGYDGGDAYYLYTTSAPNAEQTTLADGGTYWVSSGGPPSGYLATGGSGAMTSGDMPTPSKTEIASSEETGASTTSSRTSSGSPSASSSGSSAAETSQGSGHTTSFKASAGLVAGLLSLFGFYALV